MSEPDVWSRVPSFLTSPSGNEGRASARVREFLEVGQGILNWDRKLALGADFDRLARENGLVAKAQPGFLGLDYRGLVLLSLNPGVAANRPGRLGFSSKLAEWNHALTDWQMLGSMEAYREVHRFWLEDLWEWRVWTMYVAPLLADLAFTPDNTAFLNVFQTPTVADSLPTPRMFSAGWPWTKRQLEILEPAVVVAGGKRVGDLLARFWPAPPFEVLVQDRNRSLTSTVTRTWMSQAAVHVKQVLRSSGWL